MQHFKYSSLKKLQFLPEISFIKTFLKSNIKSLYTYPRSIYYSQRYNAGEKFLLRDANLFPYYYNNHLNREEELEPLNQSIALLAATNESFVLRYPNLKQNAFSMPKVNEVYDNFRKNFSLLVNLLSTRSDDIDKLDLPVVVYSRILYASVIANSRSNSNKLNLGEEGFKVCIDKFMEKLEYADSESTAYVMFALSHFGYYDAETWRLLANSLNEKLFVPEFSLVSHKEPHVFRYEDVDNKFADSDLLDEFGNKLFIRGYMPVFLAYSALLNANGNGVDCQEAIRNIAGRFPNVNQDVENFNSSMFE